ncbi:ATP-dependent zinc metalloprotease FtsH [Mageeibacillus indolicus]|uniref:ATP-dependent zinc metalloprotease FtsH n=1 Tax=Mageeibacillus indolicus (strain UPII9-5) TaxID=699246 RepID=D3R207_MAGIU|nr:ATP-dependent zinc metalloprotease FtsH [Mageeibacillus indolicus]ADC90769.1 ATP-dependent metallopeptidase HflB [Mageeibacillus indolicus UPII9-5]KFA57416.1 cell division protein FtsH [Mageeibacillus indolicus 0009-5]
MKRKPLLSGISFYIIVIAVILLVSTYLNSGSLSQNKVYYSEILNQLQSNNVDEVEITGNTVELTLKKPIDKNSQNLKVKKTISPFWMGELLSDLKKAAADHKLKFDYSEPINFGGWINGIMLLVMFGAMGLFFYFAYVKQSGDSKNAMTFGRSRAKRFDPTQNKITFDDVAGVEEEKHELQEVVDFLKNPKKYSELGARIPRGILLVGPPGTGKTLLAKAVAGEAGVPFFSISGSDFVEMFVGVGASRVRDLFAEVKKHSPAIIFIDEIDAVGRHRGAGMGGGHDEREQTLNQLLVEMDGFGPNEDAIIMAATNRPDILDPALLRPGRFDRQVTVMRPDLLGREAILKVHSKSKPLDPSIDLKEVARITPGFTGADLANLLNEAALLCARRNAKIITYNDISEAVFKVMIGPEKKSHLMNDHDKTLTSYHEAGHAIILRTVSTTDRVERVSIIPAGGAGGYTAHKPYEDHYYNTQKMLLAEIMVALGGRAAEEILYGEVSTGASSDLQHCNSIARDMICKYGMSEKLPNLVFGSNDNEVFLGRDYGHVKNYSSEIAGIIDEEVRCIITKAYTDVLAILRAKWKALDALAKVLINKEKIEGGEFEEIYLLNTTEADRAGDADNPAVAKFSAGIQAKLNKVKIDESEKSEKMENTDESTAESRENSAPGSDKSDV